MARALEFAGVVEVSTDAGNFQFGAHQGQPAFFFPSFSGAWKISRQLKRCGLAGRPLPFEVDDEIVVHVRGRPLARIGFRRKPVIRLTPLAFLKEANSRPDFSV